MSQPAGHKMQTMSSFIHYIDPQPGVGGGPISQPASQFGADPEVQTMDSFVQFLDEPVVVQGNIPITQPPTGSTPSSNERADPRIFMTISELVTGNGSEPNNVWHNLIIMAVHSVLTCCRIYNRDL